MQLQIRMKLTVLMLLLKIVLLIMLMVVLIMLIIGIIMLIIDQGTLKIMPEPIFYIFEKI